MSSETKLAKISGLGPLDVSTVKPIEQQAQSYLDKQSVYNYQGDMPKVTTPTGYDYGATVEKTWWNPDGRATGQLFQKDGQTMVSGSVVDSVAGLNDYVAAGDYGGAVKAGFKGSEKDFGAMQTASAGKSKWSMDGYGSVALGAGQLGLGVLSYMDNKKTADKQRELMGQQIKNNKFALTQAKGHQADISRTFGKGL